MRMGWLFFCVNYVFCDYAYNYYCGAYNSYAAELFPEK